MNDDKVTDMFIKLMDEIHQNTSALKDMIANHEARISVLEKSDDKKEDGWKNTLLLLLAKACVIGLVTVGSLTGATKLIQAVLNVNVPAQTEVQK